MKLYSAYFEYSNPLTPQSLKDFTWWEAVMLKLLERCDGFQIECSRGDDVGLRSCARMGAEDRATLEVDGRHEVWRGKTEEAFSREFLKEAFDARGKVKWASILLRNGDKTIVAITKNGKEIGLHGLSEEELDFLAKSLHGNNFSFYYWEESGNGQLTHFKPIYGGESEISEIFEAYYKGKPVKPR